MGAPVIIQFASACRADAVSEVGKTAIGGDDSGVAKCVRAISPTARKLASQTALELSTGARCGSVCLRSGTVIKCHQLTAVPFCTRSLRSEEGAIDAP